MADMNYTAMLIVLDRSGSMEGSAKEMAAAAQHLVDSQAAGSGMVTVDVVTFDNVIEHTYAFAQPGDVKIVLEPRGGTALFDAIGMSFAGFGAALAALPEHARPGTVLATIVTDGEENSSQEYDRAAIERIIRRQRDDYDWDVSFLGANQDAVLAAGHIGIDAKDALTFDMHNIAPMMAAHAAKLTRRRAGDRTGYTQAERGAADPTRP
ncbi:MAG: VWA domain-containing protein [Actinobacteria bacterium]|nr:VWA domain-containing protein [Actinomycetota bacterium]